MAEIPLKMLYKGPYKPSSSSLEHHCRFFQLVWRSLVTSLIARLEISLKTVAMMSDGEQRRSARISELEARKAHKKRSQTKDKGKARVTLKDLGTGESNVNLKRRRKHIKTKSIQDLVCNYSLEDHNPNSDVTLSETVLPPRRKLRVLLEALKNQDGQNIFAEPVNPDEVEGYYDTIKEPMDFGTMTMKLEERSYQKLAEFERDVTLVYSNAMLFNASTTVFYRQAKKIRDLAQKLFALLRADPENFEMAVARMRLRAGRRQNTGVQISNSGTRNQSTVGIASNGSREERQYLDNEEDQLGGYRPLVSFLNKNESISSSLYNNPEPILAVVDTKLDKVGYRGSLTQFVKDLGPMALMVTGQKLQRSTAAEAFNNQSATTHRQLQTQNHGMSNAPTGNNGDCTNLYLDFVRNATSSQNLSGTVDIQGGRVNGQKASAFDTLDYNNALSRRFFCMGSKVENPRTFGGISLQVTGENGVCFKQSTVDQTIGSPYFSSPWNSSPSNSNSFIPNSINKGKNVVMLQAGSSHSKENPGNHSRNLDLPVGGYNFSKENASYPDSGKVVSTPSNQDNFVSNSIIKSKNILIAEPTSLFPLQIPGYPERASLQSMKEMEGTAVKQYPPNQGNGGYNFSGMVGAGNSYLGGTENTQGNSDKFYHDAVPMGMNVQTAGMNPGVLLANTGDNLKQSAQTMGDGGAAFKELMRNLGFGGGIVYRDPYFLVPSNSDSNPGKFIPIATNQGISGVQVPGLNFSGPRIQDLLSAMHHGISSSASLQWPPPAVNGPSLSQAQSGNRLDLYLSSREVQLQAAGGYGGGASNGVKLGQAGQTSSWLQPTTLLPQPVFDFPMQGQLMTAGAGLGGQAAALQLQAPGTRGGADEQKMAGASAINYPSHP